MDIPNQLKEDIINALIMFQMRSKQMPTPAYLYETLQSQYGRARVRAALNSGIKTRRGKVMFYEYDHKVMFVPMNKRERACTIHLRNMQGAAQGQENDLVRSNGGFFRSHGESFRI